MYMHSSGTGAALAIILLLVELVAWLGGVAITVLFIWLAYRCLASIPKPFRKQEPALAWFLLIPLFNIIWMFFVYPPLAEGYQAYFASRGRRDVGDCGYRLNKNTCLLSVFGPLIWAVLSVVVLGVAVASRSLAFAAVGSVILYIGGGLVGLITLIMWIMVYVKAWHFKRLIEEDLAAAATAPMAVGTATAPPILPRSSMSPTPPARPPAMPPPPPAREMPRMPAVPPPIRPAGTAPPPLPKGPPPLRGPGQN